MDDERSWYSDQQESNDSTMSQHENDNAATVDPFNMFEISRILNEVLSKARQCESEEDQNNGVDDNMTSNDDDDNDVDAN